jgi:hypothetical protein
MKTLNFLFTLAFLFFAGQAICQNPFDYVGKEHNEGLKYLMSKITDYKDRPSFVTQAKAVLSEKFPSQYMAGFDHIVQFKTMEDALNYSKKSNSPALHQEIESVISLLKISLNVEEIWSNIENRETRDYSFLSQKEKDNYLAFLSTVKHSAGFWLPVENGGENGLQNLLIPIRSGNDNQGEEIRAIKWYKVILQDALGTVVGGAIGGPAGAVAGLVAQSLGEVISQIP